MMCLLLSGATDVGKTTAVYAVKNYLENKRHFTIIAIDPSRPVKQEDFNALLKGKSKNGKTIHIGLMSGLDTKKKNERGFCIFLNNFKLNVTFM